MNKLRNLICGLAFCLAAASLQAAVHYDLANDFSISNGNPNGVWSYGAVSAEGDFTPFDSPELAPDDNGLLVELWANGNRSAIFHNQNDQDAISNGGEGVLPPNSVWFSAIAPDKLAAARFTAPAKGKYELSAEFAKIYTTLGNKQDLHIYVNGRQIWSHKIKLGQRPVRHNAKLNLKAGDVITIAVGNDKDGEFGDVLFVNAHIVKR